MRLIVTGARVFAAQRNGSFSVERAQVPDIISKATSFLGDAKKGVAKAINKRGVCKEGLAYPDGLSCLARLVSIVCFAKGATTGMPI